LNIWEGVIFLTSQSLLAYHNPWAALFTVASTSLCCHWTSATCHISIWAVGTRLALSFWWSPCFFSPYSCPAARPSPRATVHQLASPSFLVQWQLPRPGQTHLHYYVRCKPTQSREVLREGSCAPTFGISTARPGEMCMLASSRSLELRSSSLAWVTQTDYSKKEVSDSTTKVRVNRFYEDIAIICVIYDCSLAPAMNVCS
jgi:hypothetical protein